ncbi:MAG: hypothetical protein ABL957_16865 [Parvularculaceae bacterium]
MHFKTLLAASAASTMALVASAPAYAAKYIVLAKGNGFPTDIDAKVVQAGGVLEKIYPFGVAIVSGPDAGIGKITGATVVKDHGFDTQQEEKIAAADLAEFGFPPNSGDNDRFFNLQYGHNYVGAQQSWELGFRGQGVRVAVLDGGFDLDHPDLAPGIDFASSADMTGEGLAPSALHLKRRSCSSKCSLTPGPAASKT